MIAVKQFSSAEEMMAHYKAVNARLFNPKPKRAPAAVALQEDPPKPEMQFAKEEPAPLAPGFLPKANARRIVAEVAERHGFKPSDIYGKGKRPQMVAARWEAIGLVRQANPNWTLHQFGRFFDRDHTTILHVFQKLDRAEAA